MVITSEKIPSRQNLDECSVKHWGLNPSHVDIHIKLTMRSVCSLTPRDLWLDVPFVSKEEPLKLYKERSKMVYLAFQKDQIMLQWYKFIENPS